MTFGGAMFILTALRHKQVSKQVHNLRWAGDQRDCGGPHLFSTDDPGGTNFLACGQEGIKENVHPLGGVTRIFLASHRINIYL